MKINKNVGSEYDNSRIQKLETIYKLLQEFIVDFNVEVLTVKYNKSTSSDPELFVGHSHDRTIDS